MGFHKVYGGAANQPIDPIYAPLKNSESFAPGILVKLVNGELTKATSNAEILGVLEHKGTIIGDGVTLGAVVGHEQGAIFEIEQDPLSDANSQPGDKCDINANAVAVAASSNNDLIVVPDNGAAQTGKIWVKLTRRQAGA